MNLSSRRLKESHKEKKSIYIYCEGESEVKYFKMLRRKYDSSNVGIAIRKTDKSGDALGMIKYALKQTKQQINEKRNKRKRKIHYLSDIYIIFDRDGKSNAEIEEIYKEAAKNNIKIMFSSTSFEVWILMHFEQVASTEDHSQKWLENKLSKYFETNYHRFKGNDYDGYTYDKVGYAVKNAKKLYRKNSNPITDKPFTNIQESLSAIFGIKVF
ncbi:RloB family protein [Lactobacillus amylovorus]|uniref:RloB family protein n=1 Tax=Lactobacillus amylovorus TaxID=1604 RepID=UPI00313D3BEC|nr:RloB family protein [Lactobacillus amylovorus]